MIRALQAKLRQRKVRKQLELCCPTFAAALSAFGKGAK